MSCQSPTPLYPQLANVSRTLSPRRPDAGQTPTLNTIARHQGRSPSSGEHLSIAPDMNASPSECSSESWSDDSGYINLNMHTRMSVPLDMDNRIEDWLSLVPKPDISARRRTSAEPSLSNRRPIASVRQVYKPQPALMGLRHRETISQPHHGLDNFKSLFPSHRALVDPYHFDQTGSGDSSPSGSATLGENSNRPAQPSSAQRHVSDVCKRLNFDQLRLPDNDSLGNGPFDEPISDTLCPQLPQTKRDASEEDTDLAPLSPNVCVERGPSCYQFHTQHRHVIFSRRCSCFTPVLATIQLSSWSC